MALTLLRKTLDNDINKGTKVVDATIILEVFEKTEVQSSGSTVSYPSSRVFSSVMILTSETLSLSLSASVQLSSSTIELCFFMR